MHIHRSTYPILFERPFSIVFCLLIFSKISVVWRTDWHSCPEAFWIKKCGSFYLNPLVTFVTVDW